MLVKGSDYMSDYLDSNARPDWTLIVSGQTSDELGIKKTQIIVYKYSFDNTHLG